MTYLLFLIASFCLAYFLLRFIFSSFFEQTSARLNARSVFFSLSGIVCSILIVYIVSYAIPNAEIGNRILHIFGGGFLSFLLCFLVVKDSGLRIGRFRFFVFSFFVTVTLGVANEIAEFFLQHYLAFDFARTITDTWLDLLSNVVGAVIAGVCFVPFITPARKKHTLFGRIRV